jgi:hypothetical protein
MDPFDIQMYVSRYHALDTKHIRIFVKFEHRSSISVLRKSHSLPKKKVLSHACEKKIVSLFSP